jgi:rhomboid protease GluP
MRQLPPAIDKFLSALGVNTNRLRWKLHYLEQGWERKRAAAYRAGEAPKYKACRHCAHLALAEDKVCKCGRRLPSYTVYRVTRALALDAPGGTVVSLGFVMAILGLFAALVLTDKDGSIMGPSRAAAHAFGAFDGGSLPSGQYWRVFAFALMHFGIIHVAFNAMAISQMLPRFETDIGPWRTLLVITLTQIGAVVATVVWYGDSRYLTAGASGVAFGLIGFGLAYAHRRGNTEERAFFVHWLIYGAVFGLILPLNNAAHAGGFLLGLPLGFWMAGREPRGAMRVAIRIAGAACFVAWGVSVVFLGRSVMAWLG